VPRVAFSADLGVPPVEAEVASICRAAAGWWQQQQGATLTEAAPDLQDMQQVFLVGGWAAWYIGKGGGKQHCVLCMRQVFLVGAWMDCLLLLSACC
jgi:hypothetical protein